MRENEEQSNLKFKIISILILVASLLLLGLFIYFRVHRAKQLMNPDVVTETTNEENKENEETKENTNGENVEEKEEPVVNVDTIHIANGTMYNEYTKTIEDYNEGKTEWYQDSDGVVYIQSGKSLLMSGLEFRFGSVDEIEYRVYREEADETEFDIMVIPIDITNTTDEDKYTLPNQFYFRAFTPAKCDLELIDNSDYKYPDDITETIQVKSRETVRAYAYIPYFGKASSEDIEGDIKEYYPDEYWYYQILIRYPSSRFVNVAVLYNGPFGTDVKGMEERHPMNYGCVYEVDY